MGKIRVKTLGDEEQSKKDQKKAEARAVAKKAKEEAAAKKSAEETVAPADVVKEEVAVEAKSEQKEKKTTKKAKFDKTKAKTHSSAYLTVAAKIDKNKKYSLNDALSILPELKLAKFDETVELHINTVEKGISGNVTLPHGTGKTIRVVIANQGEDPKAVEELVKKIEAGQIDFDVLIATPDTMPKLAKVARVLGPRGLMPNPKNGTVTPKPTDAAKKFEGGQMNFKTEAKFPLLHLTVGKVSFGEKKLADNIKTAIAAIQTKNIQTVTLKSTMSPGLKLDISSL